MTERKKTGDSRPPGRLIIPLAAFMCLAAPGFLAPLPSPAGERRLEKVVVGELPVLPSIGVFIAKEKGYFEDQGLDVEFRMHKRSSQVIPLLTTGDLDVGGGGISAGVYNAIASGGGMRIVADRGHHPWQGPFKAAHGIVVSSKLYPGELTGEVLRGQRFAVSGRGNPQEIYLELFLGEYGLELGDVKLHTMPVTSMLPALANGSLFGAALLEPFLTLAQEKGMAVPVMSDRELYPGQQGGVVMYSGSFIKEREETAVRYMTGYLQGVRTFNDYMEGKVDAADIFDIVRKHTSLRDFELFKKIGKPSLHSEGRLNLEGMKRDLKWLVGNGYVEEMPEMSRIVDLRFIEQAGKAPAE